MNGRLINIIALDHIVLRTSQLAEMVHFYQDILGCSIERQKPDIGLTQLRAGSALIDIVTVDSELGKLGGKAPQQNGRNVDHFCLQVSAFDEQQLIDYLKQHQLKLSDFAPRYGAQGYGRSVYVDDPEGNVVELKPYKENWAEQKLSDADS
ncbi:VOC family protein [Vibrio brasiliensis]|uniref:VOC family protein n=1 Tax=Vibrio brasiliensis TaxID=170652 RepID=UPI001EFD0442|nr:VOC family protein [Vibrio brasiliensis]MCG9724076.1 VOC family protein [Vibrio brasiliensis]